MSDIIRVLEGLGRSPGIAMARREQYAAAIAASDLDARQQVAFENRDASALHDLVGARGAYRCLIATPD